ncbi:Probable beta-1,3-galactosyltransferase 12 [Linum perenne]
MPLFSHRSHSSSSSSLPTVSSKTFKPKKSGLLPSSFSVRHISPILIFSFFSLLVGIAGTLFAITAIRRPQPLPVFRCGGSEDTFRAFYSASAHRLGGDHNDHELVDRPKFLGFVGIQTGFDSVDRRAALRETWFPSDPDGLLRLEQATGLAFRFVIGYSKDPKKMQQLQKEVEKYRDFLIIDNEEEYLKLPYKTLTFFKAAYKHFEAEYYVKADDDIYLRPDRLATLLAKERTHSRTYIGCMKKGPVITDPKLKWQVTSTRNQDTSLGMSTFCMLMALSMSFLLILLLLWRLLGITGHLESYLN